MTISASQPKVLWLQVCGLAGVQGAITLAWVIYNAYLPQLLVEYGFSPQFAITLLVIENALGVVMEPLMGGLSDRARRWTSKQLPLIWLGVILSAVLFVAIPTIVIFPQVSAVSSWILPGVAIAWALAMTVFRSPAISLLGKYARPAALPLAASLLTISSGLIGAFKPIAQKSILSLGPFLTFAIGSAVMLIAVAVLRSYHAPETAAETTIFEPISWQQLVSPLLLVAGTGAGVAWGSRLLIDTLRVTLERESPQDASSLLLGLSIALAFAALPAGAFAAKVGNRTATILGLAVTAGLMLLVGLIPNRTTIAIAILGAIASFSTILNGVVPFALSQVPRYRAGLAVGIYFAGLSAASSLFGIVFGSQAQISPGLAAFLGAIAFGGAGFCIWSGKDEIRDR
jgi:MFS family permease